MSGSIVGIVIVLGLLAAVIALAIAGTRTGSRAPAQRPAPPAPPVPRRKITTLPTHRAIVTVAAKSTPAGRGMIVAAALPKTARCGWCGVNAATAASTLDRWPMYECGRESCYGVACAACHVRYGRRCPEHPSP